MGTVMCIVPSVVVIAHDVTLCIYLRRQFVIRHTLERHLISMRKPAISKRPKGIVKGDQSTYLISRHTSIRTLLIFHQMYQPAPILTTAVTAQTISETT